MGVARWLRVDLHAHSPFDDTRPWGRSAGKARDRGIETSEQQARSWLDRCVDAELDIVAVTDHNRLDGYDAIAAVLDQWRSEADSDLCLLPGVELSVAGCHFLVVADPQEREWLERLVGQAFGTREPIRSDRRPEEAAIGVKTFAESVEDAAESGRSVLALPAHIDREKGLANLRGLIAERAFAQRAWSGFQVRGDDFTRSRDLLRLWAAASLFGRLPDELEYRQAQLLDDYVRRDAWPLVDASDPASYDQLGAIYTWLKMSVPGVEGVRQALLDPESRLRRHAEAPPSPPATWIERIEIEGIHIDGTSLFEAPVAIEFSPALNAIIGGRGTGKSTIVELVRWALDRNRPSDFSALEKRVKEPIDRRLSATGEGILAQNSRVRIVVQRDGRPIEVERTLSELTAQPVEEPGDYDVRKLIEPRILSQRQIGEIARDPRALRREVDHAAGEDLSRWQDRRDTHARALEGLQAQRRNLRGQLEQRAAADTDVDLLARKIDAIEQVAKSETLTAHRDVQRQARWLKDLLEEIEGAAEQAPAAPLLDDAWPPNPPSGPASQILKEVHEAALAGRDTIERLRRQLVGALAAIDRVVRGAHSGPFSGIRNPLVASYQHLIEQLRQENVELSQLDGLHTKLAAARKRSESLRQLPEQLRRLDREIAASLDRLVTIHGERRKLREAIAIRLIDREADIRLEVMPYGDRLELSDRRDRWWGGTGMRTEDWDRLVHWVHGDLTHDPEGLPGRWRQLIEALRADHADLQRRGTRAERVRGLLAPDELTGYLEGAVGRIDVDRLDAMERFVPDDDVEAQFRDRDGEFRSIGRASLGQQNTAILSLLLTVGDDPLVLDQPEDDLDNRYIYDVVVELLRDKKPTRQIITATHNANIPVNGDAECIVALDPSLDGSVSLLTGTLELPEMKDAVSNIMEGSEAAFRLRRQRYGY